MSISMRASLGTELMLLESTCHAPVVPTVSLAPASHASHHVRKAKKSKEKKSNEKKRKDKTTRFGVNLMRSQV